MPGKGILNPRSGEPRSVLSAFQPQEIEQLSHCTLCPRECGADRFSNKLGYCKSDAGFRISSICIHKGEEPVISGEKGICNIFFPHCNLQCIYCQNYDISQNETCLPVNRNFDELIGEICTTLDNTENIVGFVSPSHYIPQMLAIIRGIKATGRNPVFVYNSNGYDKVESLKTLEGIIDVYLPDFKYKDNPLALNYSKVNNYAEIASAALQEMYRQKGATLVVGNNGIALSGMIIRHLVLPKAVEQSIEVLKYIAEELSRKLHISLMSQYFPTGLVADHPILSRCIHPEEYQKIVAAFLNLGFYKGWVQDLSSHASFRPNFSDNQPFEL